MFERPRSGERALLIHIKLHSELEQATLEEFNELASSAGAEVLTHITGSRQKPDPSTFIGRGKLAEIADYIAAENVELVLFNHSLTPVQERNIERELKCRVLDRAGVILDIFAQRARSFEGKLQVELAQLQHLSTRLIRGWTHLERQKGGIGLRGPGETQLETDRRLLNERIKTINRRLEKVSQQRELSRRARKRAEIPVVSLVGYTNAGKSTLFNRITESGVYAADQLFATLDATLRRVELPNKTAMILADTVGFIQSLPHDLVAAFRATLNETREADLLLHVVDANDPDRPLRINQVNEVLDDIGAQEVPQILVYNKIDCLEDTAPRIVRDASGKVTKVWLSAVTGEGIAELIQALDETLNDNMLQQWVRVPVSAGRLRAQLFELGSVLSEDYADNGDSLLEVCIHAHHFAALQKHAPELQIYEPVLQT